MPSPFTAVVTLALPLATAQQCHVQTGLGSIRGFTGEDGLCGFRGTCSAIGPVATARNTGHPVDG